MNQFWNSLFIVHCPIVLFSCFFFFFSTRIFFFQLWPLMRYYVGGATIDFDGSFFNGNRYTLWRENLSVNGMNYVCLNQLNVFLLRWAHYMALNKLIASTVPFFHFLHLTVLIRHVFVASHVYWKVFVHSPIFNLSSNEASNHNTFCSWFLFLFLKLCNLFIITLDKRRDHWLNPNLFSPIILDVFSETECKENPKN